MEHSLQLAQALILPGGTTLNGPEGFKPELNGLGPVIGALYPYFFVFSSVGLLLMLIMGGFSLLTGGSDPKQIESGKKKITFAIVGFLIVFLAYWAVQLVALIFGLDEF